jgi:hypothetical protein
MGWERQQRPGHELGALGVNAHTPEDCAARPGEGKTLIGEGKPTDA